MSPFRAANDLQPAVPVAIRARALKLTRTTTTGTTGAQVRAHHRD
jgi:hypothetical protein